MLFVIAYDISDDTRRTRLSRFLEGYGERVQLSVFECDLDEHRARRMVRGLGRLLTDTDRLRVYTLGEGGDSRVHVLGGRQRAKTPTVIVA